MNAPHREDPFRRLVELANLGLFVQCEGRFAFVNPAAVAMLGVRGEADLLGRPVLDFIHERDRDDVRERIRRINDLGEMGPALRAVWLRGDGTSFHGESTAVPYAHQGRNGALVLLHEAPRGMRIETREDRLGEEGARNRDSGPVDCLVTLDANGIVVNVNPTLGKLLGYDAFEILGCNVSLLIPELHRSGPDGHLALSLRTGEAGMFGAGEAVECVHKDGRRFDLELSMAELLVRGERLFLGMLRDLGGPDPLRPAGSRAQERPTDPGEGWRR